VPLGQQLQRIASPGRFVDPIGKHPRRFAPDLFRLAAPKWFLVASRCFFDHEVPWLV
jgi:hypothetical protein